MLTYENGKDYHDDDTEHEAAAIIQPNSGWGDQGNISCPVCRESGDMDAAALVHPELVTVDCGGTVTIIRGKGQVETQEDDHGCSARGAIIAIQLCCESGHRTQMILQFHKGSTYVRIHDVQPHATPDTLWRD